MADFNIIRETITIQLATGAIDQRIFTARDGDYALEEVSFNGAVLADSGGSATVDVMLVPDGTAVHSGTSFLDAPLALETTKATGTLTSDNTIAANNSTVTIAGRTYTFKTTLVNGTPDQVLAVTDADTTLGNLVKAINRSATAGTNYTSQTAINALVSAANVGSHATILTAKSAGTAGNLTLAASTSPNSHITAVSMTGGLGYDANTNFQAYPILAATGEIPFGASLGLDFAGTLTNLSALSVTFRVRRTHVRSFGL